MAGDYSTSDFMPFITPYSKRPFKYAIIPQENNTGEAVRRLVVQNVLPNNMGAEKKDVAQATLAMKAAFDASAVPKPSMQAPALYDLPCASSHSSMCILHPGQSELFAVTKQLVKTTIACTEALAYPNYYRIVLHPLYGAVVWLTLDVSGIPGYLEFLYRMKNVLIRNEIADKNAFTPPEILKPADFPYVLFDAEMLPVLHTVPVETWIGVINGEVYSSRHKMMIPNVEGVGVVAQAGFPEVANWTSIDTGLGNTIPFPNEVSKTHYPGDMGVIIPAHVASLYEFGDMLGENVYTAKEAKPDFSPQNSINNRIRGAGFHANYGYVNGNPNDATARNVLTGVHSEYMFLHQRAKLMVDSAQHYIKHGYFPFDTVVEKNPSELDIFNPEVYPTPGSHSSLPRPLGDYVTEASSDTRIANVENMHAMYQQSIGNESNVEAVATRYLHDPALSTENVTYSNAMKQSIGYQTNVYTPGQNIHDEFNGTHSERAYKLAHLAIPISNFDHLSSENNQITDKYDSAQHTSQKRGKVADRYDNAGSGSSEPAATATFNPYEDNYIKQQEQAHAMRQTHHNDAFSANQQQNYQAQNSNYDNQDGHQYDGPANNQGTNNLPGQPAPYQYKKLSIGAVKGIMLQ